MVKNVWFVCVSERMEGELSRDEVVVNNFFIIIFGIPTMKGVKERHVERSDSRSDRIPCQDKV